MPIYTYQVIKPDGSPGETFDVVRKMSDPPLTEHPETGEPVKRIFSPIHIAGPGSEHHQKALTSDKNLEKHGFTKYVKSGKGKYERRVGDAGPEHLSAD